jgi:predicted nucleotidyltransferase component of viral defense system
MCHYEDYRYSADLDFSLAEGAGMEESLARVADALVAAKTEIGFPTLQMEPGKEKEWWVVNEGPVGIGMRIKVDISDDELVFSPEQRPIFPRYEDLTSSEGLPVYSLVEITAEKFRCVIQRSLCRDLFDLHFLLEEAQVDLDDAWAMFEEKASHKGIDPALFFPRLDERLESTYRQMWDGEMTEHLAGDVPHFNEIRRKVRARVRPKRG